MARITLAGESLIAQKQGAQQVLQIARFIYANVPGLDPQKPIDRAAGKPPAGQIVHTYTIPPENTGYVNPNQVVFSSMLGSDIGDFDWNWLGLESAEGVLFAVAYVPLQQKRKNIPPAQIGNNVTRNILVEFSGAQELTGISIDASTWQHDFTVRLKGIDERERMSNRDVYGRATFFRTAMQFQKVGSSYQLAPGVAYLEGIRFELTAAVPVAAPLGATQVWLRVSQRQVGNDVVPHWVLVYEPAQVDYMENGTWIYCIQLADITSAGVIVDYRTVEPIDAPLVQHFAARVGTYPQLRAQATTKEDVKLGNIPNAISDDPATNSSQVLATTAAAMAVQRNVNDIVYGPTPAWFARRLVSARWIAVTGAATGGAAFDGTSDISIPLVLENSGVAAGSYPKVQVNAKGLVVAGQQLLASDIPALDWSKINSGKPTTLAGYGITDALRTGYSNQVPRFYSPIPGGDYQATALEIREAALVEGATQHSSYAPRMSFHWGTVASGILSMTSEGYLRWNGNRFWDTGNFDPTLKADRSTTLAGYGITDALRRGDQGLGSSTAAASVVDTIGLPGGFHVSYTSPTTLVQNSSVLNMPYVSSAYAAQIALQHGADVVRMFARSTTNRGTWTPTVELFHTGNLDPSAILPAGSIIMFPLSVPPAGFLKANGAAVSRTTYARLFAVLSTWYGAGDGVSTFNLPDMRGEFPRGWDDGRGLDPDRMIGSVQGSQNLWHNHTALAGAAGSHSHTVSGTAASAGEHSHPLKKATVGNNTAGSYVSPSNEGGTLTTTDPAGAHTHTVSGTAAAAGDHTHDVTVYYEGGAEARPRNIALLACIKY